MCWAGLQAGDRSLEVSCSDHLEPGDQVQSLPTGRTGPTLRRHVGRVGATRGLTWGTCYPVALKQSVDVVGCGEGRLCLDGPQNKGGK